MTLPYTTSMPSELYNELQSNLASLLVRAGVDTARRLRELNYPLAVDERQILVTGREKDLNGWSSSEVIIKQSVLHRQSVPLYRVSPLLSPDSVSAARDCARRIVDLPESQLPFFSPFQGNAGYLISDSAEATYPGYKSDPVEWTLRHLLLPALLENLAKSIKPQKISSATARNFAVEVLEVAMADDMKYRLTVPIAGIKVASTVATADGKVAFRRLSPSEQGSLLTSWGLASMNFGTVLPATALELLISTGRSAQNPDVRELVATWYCALLLCGYDVGGYRATVEQLPNWVLPFGPMNMPTPLPMRMGSVNWTSLSPSKLGKLMETVGRLARYSISDPRSERDLALHRFSSGAARSNHVDGILDFVIALESLLLPYDEDARRGDLGYRFRLHGAHYLSKTKSERSIIAKKLTDLYSLRSRLVHGGKYPSAAEIQTGWNSARQLAQIGLGRAVAEGFPSAVQFKAKLLGS